MRGQGMISLQNKLPLLLSISRYEKYVSAGTLCGFRSGFRLRLPPPFTVPVNFASETKPCPRFKVSLLFVFQYQGAYLPYRCNTLPGKAGCMRRKPCCDKVYRIALNRYPTEMIVTVMIATKTASRGTFSTFLRMIISGSDRAVTAIMKARTVPMLMPFSMRA